MFEQHQVMLYSGGDNEIIGLINLHIVMEQICNRIYIKDFSNTDIISPGMFMFSNKFNDSESGRYRYGCNV